MAGLSQRGIDFDIGKYWDVILIDFVFEFGFKFVCKGKRIGVGGGAYKDKDQFLGAFGKVKNLRGPWLPMNGRGGLASQKVCGLMKKAVIAEFGNFFGRS